ncbi:hypothetical protein [Halosimplex sp. TS25]|uniref:DUF7311 family protein n=1 Tax=Halosimplex rarum TaxID=3396619 RepID=UPI0039ECCC33
MIRYVLAVLLTVAIIGISMPAIEQAAVDRSQKQVETAVADIEVAATSLIEEETLPPAGVRGPQRVVEAPFPTKGYFTAPVQRIEIELGPDAEASVVRYWVQGGPRRTAMIDAPIVNVNGNEVKLGLSTGTQRFVLTLERSESLDQPVVVLSRPQ